MAIIHAALSIDHDPYFSHFMQPQPLLLASHLRSSQMSGGRRKSKRSFLFTLIKRSNRLSRFSRGIRWGKKQNCWRLLCDFSPSFMSIWIHVYIRCVSVLYIWALFDIRWEEWGQGGKKYEGEKKKIILCHGAIELKALWTGILWKSFFSGQFIRHNIAISFSSGEEIFG